MNYYGWILQDDLPVGFSEALRGALLRVTPERPFRGCAEHTEGKYGYHCSVEGNIFLFLGREWIRIRRSGSLPFALPWRTG